jgi:hypothetical protein
MAHSMTIEGPNMPIEPRRGALLLLLSSQLGCDAPAPAPEAASAPDVVSERWTLPTPRLAELQNAARPASLTDDLGFELGGIGSDLWRAPTDPPNEFWMVTDRGPNGEVRTESGKRRTFPVPAFAPHIVRVRVGAGSAEIVEALTLVGASGKPITGLPNCAERDERPFDAAGQHALAFDTSGLDPEGLVRAPNGEFWLAEEYAPSLVRVAADGRVLTRYVPVDAPCGPADYALSKVLPAVYGRRRQNRGFEGLALAPDGRRLVALLQSPLLVPDEATGERSRNVRALVFDIASERPVAEYVYRTEIAADIDPECAEMQSEIKLSGVVALDEHQLLVLERTDARAKLFHADMRAATNILGREFGPAQGVASLEACTALERIDVRPLAKSLAVDLAALAGMPHKIEGLAVLAAQHIVVANDDDFDIGRLDIEHASGARLAGGPGTHSELIVIRLGRPLW